MSPLNLAETEERVYADLAILLHGGRDLLGDVLISDTRDIIKSISKNLPPTLDACSNRVRKMLKKDWATLGTVRGLKMSNPEGKVIIIDEGGRMFEQRKTLADAEV